MQAKLIAEISQTFPSQVDAFSRVCNVCSCRRVHEYYNSTYASSRVKGQLTSCDKCRKNDRVMSVSEASALLETYMEPLAEQLKEKKERDSKRCRLVTSKKNPRKPTPEEVIPVMTHSWPDKVQTNLYRYVLYTSSQVSSDIVCHCKASSTHEAFEKAKTECETFNQKRFKDAKLSVYQQRIVGNT